MAEVRIFEGESIESALRRFKRQVQQEGIIKTVKQHSFFLKPGEKKRLKSKLAQKLKRKKVRRQPTDSDSKASPRSRQSQYQPRRREQTAAATSRRAFGWFWCVSAGVLAQFQHDGQISANV